MKLRPRPSIRRFSGLVTALVLTAPGLVLAGPAPTVLPPPAQTRPPWDNWSDPIGQNENHPFIQSLHIGGRLNYQAVHLRGHDLDGVSFRDNYQELRRLWLGGKINFLRYFQAGGNAIFASDERPQGREVDFSYQKFFDLSLSADLKGLLRLRQVDRLRFRYGRIKHSMSYTGRQSQRFNKTVERTALANKLFYPFAAMSATIDLEHDRWSHQLSLYGTENGGAAYGSLSHPEWGTWEGGLALYCWNRYDYRKTLDLEQAYFHFEGAYQFADENDSSWLGYRWAGTVSTYLADERWTLLVEAALGDNGGNTIGLTDPNRQGLFWGTQVEATYWFLPQSLEGVAQFAWMGAERAEGLRVDRRYLGVPHQQDGNRPARLNNRYGKSHRSFYLGLNYYQPDDRNKIMLGLEWEELSTQDGEDADMTTLWAAYRMYF